VLLHQLQSAHRPDATYGARVVAAAQDAHVHELVARDAQPRDHLHSGQRPAVMWVLSGSTAVTSPTMADRHACLLARLLINRCMLDRCWVAVAGTLKRNVLTLARG
jgi:hypothetical protein